VSFLDMRTAFAGYILTSAVCAAVMAMLWLQNRRRSPELIFWFADFLMQFLGLLLIVLRGFVPDLVSIVLANTLIVGGTLLLLIGLERHVGKVRRQWFNFVYLAAFVLAQAYFTLVTPSMQVRTINIALALFVLCSQCAWLLLSRADRQSGPRARAVGVVFVLLCLTSIAHISMALLTPIGRDLFTQARYETPVILTYQILYISLTFALFLMVNRRLVGELEDDIRRRGLAEEALRISEEKFSKAFHSAPYAITLTRLADGRIIDVNDAFTSMTGWQRAEAVGRTTPGLRLWDAQEGRARIAAELTQHRRVGACEQKFRKKNGDMLTGLFAAEVIVIDGGHHVLSTISDITERRLADEEIAQKNAELVELNNVKNQLLGMAAHDLRNPLSVVSIASAYLLDDASRHLPEARRNSFLRRINSSSKFMLKLIDDLLDVAKIEAGRLDLEPKEEDLRGLIEENLVLNRMLADKKDIRLDLTPECGLPPLRFDRGKVEQVLNNLFSNAIKFSAPGTVVTVQASRVNGSVVVSVRDQGQGIPAEELDRLFKPFGKTSVRSTGDEKSTGLGLAICHKIVEGHGGRIWAESEVGKGTTFAFSLPIAGGQTTSAKSQIPNPEPQAPREARAEEKAPGN
jgi:PAS domain S-box-containing protein